MKRQCETNRECFVTHNSHSYPEIGSCWSRVLSGIFATLLLVFTSASVEAESIDVGNEKCQPRVIKGEIDLRCWQGESLDLKGEWRFSWRPVKQTDSMAVGKAPEFTVIPGSWRYIEFESGKSPANGEARYTVNLKIDRTLSGLGLYPGLGITSYQVAIRDKSGKESVVYDNRQKDGVEVIPSGFVSLPDLAEDTELILIATNESHYSGAIEQSPRIGDVQDLVQSQFLKRAISAILFGGYIFFGIYNLILALGYRKDMVFIVLAVACFTFAVRILATEDLITTFWPTAPLYLDWHLGWITFFCLQAIWPIYVWMRYSTVVTLNFARVSTGMSLTGLILAATTEPYIFIVFGNGYRIAYMIALALIIPYFIYVLVKGELPGYNKEFAEKVTVVTLIIAILATISDMVLYSLDVVPYFEYTILAFFVLIAGQSFIVAKGYTRGLEKELELSSELKDLNARLEQEVNLRTHELVSANGQLEQMARTDLLTGLSNRRAFEENLTREIDRFDRTELPLSLFLLDADHFKSINDNYGHDIGDIVLKHLADMVSQEARVIDLPSRIGGEEFAILLTQTEMEGALMLAERIRNEVEKAIIITGGEEIRFTISGGIACYEKGMKSQDFFKRADQGLYLAKEGGRNRIVMYGDEQG